MNTYLEYLIFIGLLLPIVYCPGPMTMFCLSNGISIDRKNSIVAIFGGSTAYSVQMMTTFIGINLLENNPGIILLVRAIGVLYLGYLGLQHLFTNKTLTVDTRARTKSYRKSFLSGFLVAIANPKSIVVYMSIFPKFIDIHRPILSQYLEIGLIFLLLQFCSAFTYTTLGKTLFSWTKHPRNQLIFRLCVGSALLFASFLLLVT